ncbi:predicted protein [Naegleria gruberi]|uniref:Predicted protein n=1 Tax=Naegleria gruberi TaxID=5762 RepID=D2W064_NAEGR|nr:uncharacterized protein NAEGRDRAFT_74747 [Naegleria gruberi]EFC37563.1 predicted protein [Naegleria gruberi]|eukprot:XP_002670307.1 predicted protein [Naegleria gruberi strain NEG-M]
MLRPNNLTPAKYPPQSNPLKRLDLLVGSGFEHMRQDVDVRQWGFSEGVFTLKHNYYHQLKFQLACRETGRTKLFEIYGSGAEAFRGRKLGDEIDGSCIGNDFRDYIFKIRGASDHLGTCYTPGLIKYGTSCILRRPGEFGYRGWQAKRKGERRRIKLKGCILDRNLRAVSAIIIRKGALEIPGLTDSIHPKTLGPKRASKIRKLFNLSKSDDVRKYVVKREVVICKKKFVKGVKIQRLITPERIRRKAQHLKQSIQRCVKRKMEKDEFDRKFKSLKQSKQHRHPRE